MLERAKEKNNKAGKQDRKSGALQEEWHFKQNRQGRPHLEGVISVKWDSPLGIHDSLCSLHLSMDLGW